MSYLTKDQLASINVPPNSPLSPSSSGSSPLSPPEERKIGVVRGPRSPPLSNHNSLINSHINNNNENSVESTKTVKPTDTIPELTQKPSTQTSSITSSAESSHSNKTEKKTQYRNIDDIVNDLSYPLESKLSLKPNNSSVNPEDANTKKTNPIANISNYKDAQGDYVLSAALKSNNKSDSPGPYNESPITTNEPSVTPSEKNIPITQERRNSRPISLTSSLDCAGCGKAIIGRVLAAMGKKWHPEHFNCKHCGITLEYVAFFEKDGYPYCHLDYHELFSPKCGHCGNTIEGPFINALGKSWHQGHFFCRECGNPFEAGGFMVHDGFPYCEKDWIKKFAPKCKGCQEPIRGEFTNALDGMWHRECFVCKVCRMPFNSSYYYIHEGNPYCETHYREKLSN
ncbi:8444_t:CDS:2 [Cetraspora pellucida]|uniref:8444_t:CDS:1 n=1 Tax=Cetraspora pellucida TaxID=1433469 RepID=A0A9N8WEN5_9GLOM|nr:8444_t:CDS:2 [Cetraspora pellucida]